MNRFLAGLMLAVLPLLAHAQPQAAASASDAAFRDELARERARIRQEREAAERRFAEREKACQLRFAVNDCVHEARQQRRDVLADLRRQDILLNDAERKRKAAEALRKLDEGSR